jgi:hypothetical protein
MLMSTVLARVTMDCLEEGQKVFYLEDLLRRALPDTPMGPGLYDDAARSLTSAMKQVVDLSEDNGDSLALLPLSELYFQEYQDKSPADERVTRRCIPGTIPGTGPAVGFKVAERDTYTQVWRKYMDKAAIGHIAQAKVTSDTVAEVTGLTNPQKRIDRDIKRLAH